MTIAKEAWPFVLPIWGLAALLAAAGWRPAAAVAALAGLACLAFFRVPARAASAPIEVLVAPANGRVIAVEETIEPALGEAPVRRVATFLSVFDVHVQRAPLAGTVAASEQRPGRRLAAFRPAAGEVNQSHLTVLRTAGGDLVAVRQIAGLLARRAVGYLEPGDRVERGEILGIIKFGSRVDVLMPLDYEVTVAVGDRLTDGETPIARVAAAAP